MDRAPSPRRWATVCSPPASGCGPCWSCWPARRHGGSADDALPSACAVEMIHTYSLIHDDLPAMDDDDLRRGRPTCHKKFGEALAILAGDALLTGAFEVLAAGYPPRTAAVSCVELARGAGAPGWSAGRRSTLRRKGLFRRQAGRSQKRPAAKCLRVARSEDIHARKTGALFRSSLRLGVYAAQGERAGGADPDTLAAADRLRRGVRACVPGDGRSARRREHGRQGRQAGRQRRRPRQADLPRAARS